MIVYPAIDLKDGECVRLMHGRFDQVTRYDADPAARNSLRVYPNPARYATEAVFESQQAFSARLSAFSANGSVVYSEVQYVQPGTNIFTLDVSNWPAGTYFLRLEDKMTGKAVVAKLVKQK